MVSLGTYHGKTLVIHAPFIKYTRKLTLCFLQFGPCLDSLDFNKALLDKLCTASLYGKVSLRKCNLRFARVAILSYQVAGKRVSMMSSI